MRYNLVFSGQIAEHQNPADVKMKVCALLGVSADSSEELFSGKKVVLQRELSADEALKQQAVFENSGALASIEPVQDVSSQPVTCPKCGQQQPKSPTCSQCGINFSSYLRSQLRQKKPSVKPVNTGKPGADRTAPGQGPARASTPFNIDSWAPRLFDVILFVVPLLLAAYLFDICQRPYSPKSGEFTVNFPAYPDSNSKTIDYRSDYFYVAKQGGAQYYVLRSVYRNLGGMVTVQQVLEQAKEAISLRGNILQEQPSDLDGILAKEIELQRLDGKSERLKVCLDGSTLYLIGVVASGGQMDATSAARFINSFSLAARGAAGRAPSKSTGA